MATIYFDYMIFEQESYKFKSSEIKITYFVQHQIFFHEFYLLFALKKYELDQIGNQTSTTNTNCDQFWIHTT